MATIKDAIDIYQLPESTIKDYINELQDEIGRRKKAHRAELINEFKQALRNLEDEGITVITDGYCLECGEDISCSVTSDTIHFDWR